jgi:hypothetical protein
MSEFFVGGAFILSDNGSCHVNVFKHSTWLEISYIQRHRSAGSFSGIFKMAVRFCNELNNLNTAGFYTKSTKKAGKYYEVERVIVSVKKSQL